MQRVTREMLEGKIEYINGISKNKYKLYGAYGKVQLIREYGKGISWITALGSKSELFYQLDAITTYLYVEQNPAMAIK